MQPTTAHTPERPNAVGQLAAREVKPGLCGGQERGLAVQAQKLERALAGPVGDEADERAERDGDGAGRERDAPLAPSEMGHGEDGAAYEDDEDLDGGFWR